MATPPTSANTGTSSTSPVVVDLGRAKKKQVKQLREGRGKLMDEVNQVIAELKSAGKVSGSAHPVIFVVRQKANVKKLLRIPGLS